MSDLRKKLIKLANDKPELRKHLVPILKQADDKEKQRKIRNQLYFAGKTVEENVPGWHFEEMPWRKELFVERIMAVPGYELPARDLFELRADGKILELVYWENNKPARTRVSAPCPIPTTKGETRRVILDLVKKIDRMVIHRPRVEPDFKITKVTSEFKEYDNKETHTTELEITLKPLADDFDKSDVVEFVIKHWDEIKKKAPAKTPPADYIFTDLTSHTGEYGPNGERLKRWSKDKLGWLSPKELGPPTSASASGYLDDERDTNFRYIDISKNKVTVECYKVLRYFGSYEER